jgi:threonine aldolase
MHLDGARLWNACAATGLAPRDYAESFDAVSVCFSKGLGAPVGSALAGSKAFVEKARRIRKVFGGGMRQAGILAAAALYALRHHRQRLHVDHAHALKLAENIANLPGIQIELESVQTNIVIMNITRSKLDAMTAVAELRREGVLVVALGPHILRAVTHLDVSTAGIDHALTAFRKVFRS